MKKNKWELHGYYFDGKKSWIMYLDTNGNIKMKKWKYYGEKKADKNVL